MAYPNALSAYRETRVRTASQGQLIVMLYDEAIKQLDSALEILTNKDPVKKDPSLIELLGNTLVKTQSIITELMASLDLDQGGEIARNLFSLYNWFNRELLQANISHDRERISIIRGQMDELRGAWYETVSRTSAESLGQPTSGVNIAG